MKIFILGATGRTGKHILDLGLSRGHQLTAFVRSPQKITRRERALTVVSGDPLQADRLAEALAGHDAVLSAVGPSPREAFRPSTLSTECAASTVAAMTMAGVDRLAIISAALLFPDDRLSFKFFRWFIRHHLRDLTAMETVVQASDCAFTIARPPRLVDTPDEAYRSEPEALPAGADVMSFRAVAAFMLDCVEQRSHARAVVGLGAGGRA
ncbi:Flavin reductase [Minicystis rosea]|nr:Flavin reductase [Minicystis rosea]